MASTSQKKTTKKTSGKSGSRTTAKKPQPRPIRREVGGVVCLILALCVFVSYFGISAIFIDWLAVLIKGLLGYGYWLFGPALVLAGCILLFHHGRPVTLRVERPPHHLQRAAPKGRQDGRFLLSGGGRRCRPEAGV